MSNMEHFPKLTLVLGGARSGKSDLAESFAVHSGLSPVYLATATAGDGEMTARIESHQNRRGPNWRLVEETKNIANPVAELKKTEILLIDCLTLWLSNLMLGDADISSAQNNLIAAIQNCAGTVICVSNETGMGIVPDSRLGRRFRDAQGILNQSVAKSASLVVFSIAGLPQVLKGSLPKEFENG